MLLTLRDVPITITRSTTSRSAKRFLSKSSDKFSPVCNPTHQRRKHKQHTLRDFSPKNVMVGLTNGCPLHRSSSASKSSSSSSSSLAFHSSLNFCLFAGRDMRSFSLWAFAASCAWYSGVSIHLGHSGTSPAKMLSLIDSPTCRDLQWMHSACAKEPSPRTQFAAALPSFKHQLTVTIEDAFNACFLLECVDVLAIVTQQLLLLF